MINVYDLLFELCENEAVYDPDCELLESGILDSVAIIELFSILEEQGMTIYISRIDKSYLKTPRSIEKMIEDYSQR